MRHLAPLTVLLADLRPPASFGSLESGGFWPPGPWAGGFSLRVSWGVGEPGLGAALRPVLSNLMFAHGLPAPIWPS